MLKGKPIEGSRSFRVWVPPIALTERCTLCAGNPGWTQGTDEQHSEKVGFVSAFNDHPPHM